MGAARASLFSLAEAYKAHCWVCAALEANNNRKEEASCGYRSNSRSDSKVQGSEVTIRVRGCTNGGAVQALTPA